MNNIYSGNPAKVLKIRKHTAEEWSFLLSPVRNKISKGANARIKGVPGQFIMVSLPKAGEVPLTISGFNSNFIEITVRNAGKVTSQIFKISPGAYLYIRGPYGNGFPIKELENQHLLIIVGGSAIAAIKPLMEYYFDDNRFKLKKLDILAGFKSPRHILFREELDRWRKRCNLVLTVDNDEDYAWMGSIGFVVDYISAVRDIGEKTRVIVVGPPLMMTNSVRELLRHSIREENIYLSFERHMKCGVGKCGRCRIRDKYVCVDGPIFSYTEARHLID